MTELEINGMTIPEIRKIYGGMPHFSEALDLIESLAKDRDGCKLAFKNLLDVELSSKKERDTLKSRVAELEAEKVVVMREADSVEHGYCKISEERDTLKAEVARLRDERENLAMFVRRFVFHTKDYPHVVAQAKLYLKKINASGSILRDEALVVGEKETGE